MNRLVEWDSFDLRVNGEKLNALVQTMLGGSTPIEWIRIEFRNGLMRVTGAIRKFISVPFAVDITEIQAQGTTIRIPLRSASAAGFPVPMILFGLLRSQLPKDLVSYEEPATLVMSLDRFLPPFIAADVQKIWIIDGGLAVTLGRGGADLPQQ
ncbi:MAG TPA: hypothetical protein VFM36_04365 [Thermoanaerobaculia bacterium]|nr:hypothetical protein [Thermoanaerobaculia bacterium]